MNIKRLLELVWAGVYIALVLLAAVFVVKGVMKSTPQSFIGGVFSLVVLAIIFWVNFYASDE